MSIGIGVPNESAVISVNVVYHSTKSVNRAREKVKLRVSGKHAVKVA